MRTDEPVALQAMVVAVVQTILAAVVAFGVGLSVDQAAALMGVTGTVAALVGAVWARRRVTPVR